MARKKKPDRFLQDRGYVDPNSLKKGPNGYALCRQCNTEVQPPKRTFCSDDCVHNWKIRTQGTYAREQVFLRDRGVCACCGLDTEKLRAVLYRVKTEKGGIIYAQLLKAYEKKTGYDFDLDKHAWEADHIHSVADGGGACTLENYATLCVPCHRRKTKEWHRNKAKRRARFKKWKPG